jgi:hypothetical protein
MDEKKTSAPSKSNRFTNRSLRAEIARLPNPDQPMGKTLKEASPRPRDYVIVGPPDSDLQTLGPSAYHPTLIGKPTHWSA